jgi:hypothetical protein
MIALALSVPLVPAPLVVDDQKPWPVRGRAGEKIGCAVYYDRLSTWLFCKCGLIRKRRGGPF